MKEIAPSQFIEALLESQRINKLNKLYLKVRTFNKLVDELSNLNIYVQFGFSDLIEFVDNYNEYLSYKDFAIHVLYTEKLIEKVKKYNRIYVSIDNFDEINAVWKNLLM